MNERPWATGPRPDGAGKPGHLQAEPWPLCLSLSLSIPAVSQQEGRGPNSLRLCPRCTLRSRCFQWKLGVGCRLAL